MMGERNFYAQLTSDLIERQKNKKVVDEIDIGTEQDRIRFKNYQGLPQIYLQLNSSI